MVFLAILAYIGIVILGIVFFGEMQRFFEARDREREKKNRINLESENDEYDYGHNVNHDDTDNDC